MKLLILGLNYAPEVVGIGKYTNEMSEWLSDRDVDVRVITAHPYYPDWKVADGYRASRYQRETIRGIEVWRCPLYIPGSRSGMRRILHLLSFALSSLPVLLRQLFWRPDVILVIEPTFFCVPFALIAAKLCRARAWLHIQDFEIDACFQMGFLPQGGLWRLSKNIESFIMRRFDRVSTISQNMLKRIFDQDRFASKLIYFPNWADLDKIYPLAGCVCFRDEWGIDEETTVVLYSGNMGMKQGLEIVIHVAGLLSQEQNILFVLCGTGAAKERLAAMARGMENVRFIPLQPIDRFNKLLNTADIHLLPQRDEAVDLVMPSKLTGILACGGIVLATCPPGGELATTVHQAGGIICEPGDRATMAAEIKRIAADRRLRSEMHIKALNYAQNHFSKGTILGAFIAELECLARYGR